MMDSNLRILEGDLEMEDGELTGIKLIQVQLTLSGEEYEELVVQKAKIARLEAEKARLIGLGNEILWRAHGYRGGPGALPPIEKAWREVAGDRGACQASPHDVGAVDAPLHEQTEQRE